MSEQLTGGDRCPKCGKVRYLTRAHARKTAKRIKKRRDGRLNAYRCGEFWHLGHLPKSVVHGEISRDVIAPTTPRKKAS